LPRKLRFRLIDLLIVLAVAGMGTILALPPYLASRRTENERTAMHTVYLIGKAQADFHTNDRDGNGVRDYWTADVYALYGLTGIRDSSDRLPTGRPDSATPIALLDSTVAAADGLTHHELYGNIAFSAGVGHGRPKRGYVFRALHREGHGPSATTLLNDTDGPGRFYGACHDSERFGFIAFPTSLGTGTRIFLISHGNEVWKYNLPSEYWASFVGVEGDATDSSSSTGGPQLAPEFTMTVEPGQGTFPTHPGQVGCSRPE